jgi:hypothetical protein
MSDGEREIVEEDNGGGTESSPSCGWRGVYAAMEVRRDE